MVQSSITLIPWVHELASPFHYDVIKYIETLPPNSVLALEITPHQFFELNLFLDVLQGRDPYDRITKNAQTIKRLGFKPNQIKELVEDMKLNAHEYLNKLGTMFTALVEVVLTCKLKNITLVPIDNTKENKISQKLLLDVPKYTQDEAHSEWVDEIDSNFDKRDQAFAMELTKLQKRIKVPVYVLTGGLHSPYIENYLRLKGVSVSIELGIFRNPALVEMIIGLRRGVGVDESSIASDLEHNLELERLTAEVSAKEDFNIANARFRTVLNRFAPRFLEKPKIQRPKPVIFRHSVMYKPKPK